MSVEDLEKEFSKIIKDIASRDGSVYKDARKRQSILMAPIIQKIFNDDKEYKKESNDKKYE